MRAACVHVNTLVFNTFEFLCGKHVGVKVYGSLTHNMFYSHEILSVGLHVFCVGVEGQRSFSHQ